MTADTSVLTVLTNAINAGRQIAVHVHDYYSDGRVHGKCGLAGWRCTRCDRDHNDSPSCCHRCGYTVLAPTWTAT